MADPNIVKKLEDTKAISEVKLLNKFFDMMNNDPLRAYYGPKEVLYAADNQAVETLLVTDELFRSADLKKRQQYVSLVEKVKDNGGDVRILSSMHVSGEQLQKLSGVAAILRFPVTYPGDEQNQNNDDADSTDSDDSDDD